MYRPAAALYKNRAGITDYSGGFMKRERVKDILVSTILLCTGTFIGCGGTSSDAPVAGWPDVNGDGYADLAVVEGMYGFDSGDGSTDPRIHVYYGGKAAVSEPANQIISLTEIEGNLETQVMEDFNDDGYADLAVSDGDFVYIFNGGASGLSSTPDTTITVANNSLCAGDFNGDGIMDLAMGNTGYSSGRGGVLFYYSSGTGGLSTLADLTLTGTNTGDFFGASLATGDINGDGYTDLAVSASGINSMAGQVSLFYGSDTGISTTAGTTLNGETSADYFGSTMVTGDFNHDGFADLVVAAVFYDATSPAITNCGRVYIFHGTSTGITTDAAADRAITGSSDYYALGMTMSTGDVNDDGYADLALGANVYGGGGTSDRRGVVYIHNGSNSGVSATASWTKTGENESTGGDTDYFGSIVYLSDLSGDGRADLYVLAQGCPWETPDAEYIGRAYWFRSTRSGMASSASWQLDAYFYAY
ncbi:MAG: hypothetical protein CVV44_21820 [Spirochaetae bacterium HGW-Spirochaetae-1]|jgi:hypothetical protein|nr:MAG: hypothetical protein CVV44_21820 [Spirochaetae bacterium HGW-Spirochaetae-1]